MLNWYLRLLRWLRNEPTYAELAESIRDDGRALSRAAAYEQIIKMPLLLHPASATQRAELLALLAQPPDLAMRKQLDILMHAALQAQQYPMRPGGIEDVWRLEGLLDRMVQPD